MRLIWTMASSGRHSDMRRLFPDEDYDPSLYFRFKEERDWNDSDADVGETDEVCIARCRSTGFIDSAYYASPASYLVGYYNWTL